MSALIVNLFGGPGLGKSTMAADIFSELKWKGVNCELVAEYAKDKVWEKSTAVLDDQLYVFGKQYHRLFRLNDQVDVVITDSPILLSIIYDAEKRPTLKKLVIEEFQRFNNLNFLLQRSKPYSPIGRLQTEKEAIAKDVEVLCLLSELNLSDGVKWECAMGTKSGVQTIVDRVLEKLWEEQK